MITQAIIDAATGIAAWFGTLFPAAPDLTQLVTDTNSGWHSILASFVGLGVWVDWAFVLSTIGVVVSVYLVMFVTKLIRAVASYIPFVGGAG